MCNNYNNSLISRVLNEYLNTETKEINFMNDIKESVNHVLCNLRGKDNIVNSENSSDIFCGGLGNNLNIKMKRFSSNYVFGAMVYVGPVCSFNCPNVTQEPETITLTTSVPTTQIPTTPARLLH